MPLPPDELRVSEQYWRSFGEPPDDHLWGLCASLLQQGVPSESVAAAVRAHPTAIRRQESISGSEHFSAHGQSLPYRTVVTPGASVLLVCVPGILIDAAPPLDTLPPGIDAPAHVLAIGMAPEVPCSPASWQDWADAAAQLVQREAASLEVPLSHVVCYGASIQGSRALMTGARAGVGTIVVGAPDVRLGTWFDTLRTWTQNNARTQPAFALLYDWCDIAAGPVVVDRLDRLVPDACAAAPETQILGIVSRDDLFYDDLVDFVQALRATPRTAPVTLGRHDYGKHDDVFPPFWALVDQVLRSVAEGRPLPSVADLVPATTGSDVELVEEAREA